MNLCNRSNCSNSVVYSDSLSEGSGIGKSVTNTEADLWEPPEISGRAKGSYAAKRYYTTVGYCAVQQAGLQGVTVCSCSVPQGPQGKPKHHCSTSVSISESREAEYLVPSGPKPDTVLTRNVCQTTLTDLYLAYGRLWLE